MSILEIGCGPGRVTVPLARAVTPGGHVVAIDIQEGMLGKLRKRLTRCGVKNLQIRRGAFGTGELLTESLFDRAVLVAVLGETPDKSPAFRECFAFLKPSGILSITEMKPDPHIQTEQTVFTLAEQTGFEVVEVHRNRLSFTMNCQKPAPDRVIGGLA